MDDLAGKTVLVTGASSGIGWAVGRAFAARGCRVALAARRASRIRELSQLLRSEGAECLDIPCDVRKERQARKAVEAVVRRWGRIDVLINNAGIQDTRPFESQDIATIEDILRTNFLGAVYTSHAALAHMRRHKAGHIVNVASIAGLIGLPYMAAYCASKFALVGLTEALRRELRGSGITLTAFCQGTVDTPMTAEPLKDAALRKAIRPKSPEQTAEKIILAVRRRIPELIYGEVPASVLRLSKFWPGLSDWATSSVIRRMHPLVRKWLGSDSDRAEQRAT